MNVIFPNQRHCGMSWILIVRFETFFCIPHYSSNFLQSMTGGFSRIFWCSLSYDWPQEDAEKVAIIPRKICPNLAVNQICRTNLQLFFNISDYFLKPNVGIWWLFPYFFPHVLMIEILKSNIIFRIFILILPFGKISPKKEMLWTRDPLSQMEKSYHCFWCLSFLPERKSVF
jgi:hypothetical protein